MKRLLVAFALTAAIAAPAFAETMAKDMTCSAFTAMGQDAMMTAMNDAMMAGDAMASGTAKASSDAMAMSPEDSMAALVKTCTEHPDMMMSDAMHPMK